MWSIILKFFALLFGFLIFWAYTSIQWTWIEPSELQKSELSHQQQAQIEINKAEIQAIKGALEATEIKAHLKENRYVCVTILLFSILALVLDFNTAYSNKDRTLSEKESLICAGALIIIMLYNGFSLLYKNTTVFNLAVYLASHLFLFILLCYLFCNKKTKNSLAAGPRE